MPLPTPRISEAKEDFISRFMSDPDMIREFPNDKQRYAVAIETWKDR